MGVASMVLGIVGLVLSFVPCFGAYALFITIPGIVLGRKAMKNAAKTGSGKGMAIAGFVTSIVGTCVAGYWCLVIGAVAESADELSNFSGEVLSTLNLAMR